MKFGEMTTIKKVQLALSKTGDRMLLGNQLLRSSPVVIGSSSRPCLTITQGITPLMVVMISFNILSTLFLMQRVEGEQTLVVY
jgi:hypothetical protein